MAALKNTGRRYVKSNCMCVCVCVRMYATIIIHGTAHIVLHIAIEMQIAFFFVVSVFCLIVVNQPRLQQINVSE